MTEKAMIKQELKSLGRTDASIPAITGRWVKDALVMSDGEVKFSWRQYRFANIFRRTLDLDKAAEESGMARDSALRFLRRPDIQRWLDDRAKMQDTKRTWNAEGRWWAEGDRMFQMEKMPKHKLEIWREFGDRLEVKPGRNIDMVRDAVQINISADVISSIRERERAVEAEIINKSGS